nr:lauroyl-Kdo(2)-lipid IV(A) myristoyltransferase [Escherichia coli]
MFSSAVRWPPGMVPPSAVLCYHNEISRQIPVNMKN